MRPKRMKPESLGAKQSRLRAPAYLKWVRGCECAVTGCCNRPIEAAHVRKGLPPHEAGGVSMKPHDKWALPLCDSHHRIQHSVGEDTFQRQYRVNMKEAAKAHWREWPGRIKWENQND